jgi:hypothetical protein
MASELERRDEQRRSVDVKLIANKGALRVISSVFRAVNDRVRFFHLGAGDVDLGGSGSSVRLPSRAASGSNEARSGNGTWAPFTGDSQGDGTRPERFRNRQLSCIKFSRAHRRAEGALVVIVSCAWTCRRRRHHHRRPTRRDVVRARRCASEPARLARTVLS